MNMPSRQLLSSLYNQAVQRALPKFFLKDFLPAPPKGRTIVIGAGKASAAMALALDEQWPASQPMQGFVITRYAHTPAEQKQREAEGRARIKVVEASHPVPDQAGMLATQSMLRWLSELQLTGDDLVVCLISGGGSALLALPVADLGLTGLQALNQSLLLSGASIDEMNCVRKHVSLVQGGRLAAACYPAAVHSLLISDVPGDDPQVIASGPTLPDPTTCEDALGIIKRYNISLPTEVIQGLTNGRFESPKPGSPKLQNAHWVMCATPQQSLQAAALAAQEMGLAAHILSDEIEGESRLVGQLHAAIAKQILKHQQPFAAPCVLLSGGETTVSVRNPQGKGGRAVEFVLGCALAIAGLPNVHVLAADTDGIDGVAGHAGAFADGTTIARAQAMGLSAQQFLDNNDAFTFFDALGDTLVTGPSFTNVNDFRAVLITL
jgi:glycerate 2-kinase